MNTVIRAGRLTKRWSPFQHVGLVPAQSFRAAAVIMLGIAVSSALAATWIFQRRDLTGP